LERIFYDFVLHKNRIDSEIYIKFLKFYENYENKDINKLYTIVKKNENYQKS